MPSPTHFNYCNTQFNQDERRLCAIKHDISDIVNKATIAYRP